MLGKSTAQATLASWDGRLADTAQRRPVWMNKHRATKWMLMMLEHLVNMERTRPGPASCITSHLRKDSMKRLACSASCSRHVRQSPSLMFRTCPRHMFLTLSCHQSTIRQMGSRIRQTGDRERCQLAIPWQPTRTNGSSLSTPPSGPIWLKAKPLMSQTRATKHQTDALRGIRLRLGITAWMRIDRRNRQKTWVVSFIASRQRPSTHHLSAPCIKRAPPCSTRLVRCRPLP